jgi:hypothetical protein
MIRRICLLWDLHAHEHYVKQLHREGWTDEETAHLRHHCQALRVQLALQPQTQVEDAIVWAGIVVVSILFAGSLIWP